MQTRAAVTSIAIAMYIIVPQTKADLDGVGFAGLFLADPQKQGFRILSNTARF